MLLFVSEPYPGAPVIILLTSMDCLAAHLIAYTLFRVYLRPLSVLLHEECAAAYSCAQLLSRYARKLL